MKNVFQILPLLLTLFDLTYMKFGQKNSFWTKMHKYVVGITNPRMVPKFLNIHILTHSNPNNLFDKNTTIEEWTKENITAIHK